MKLWRVDDVMTTDVVAVREDTPYRELVDLLISRRVSAVPVVDGTNRIVGLVSEADLLLKVSDLWPPRLLMSRRYRRNRGKARARVAADVMSSPARTVLPSLSVAAAARRMQREQVKRFPVENELGRLVGIVTRSDLLKVHLRPDAEIRRDVVEEILRQALAIEAGTVRVQSTDGLVSLAGHLHLRTTADRAVELTAHVPGVVGVTNELTYDIDDRMPTGAQMGAPFGIA